MFWRQVKEKKKKKVIKKKENKKKEKYHVLRIVKQEKFAAEDHIQLHSIVRSFLDWCKKE